MSARPLPSTTQFSFRPHKNIRPHVSKLSNDCLRALLTSVKHSTGTHCIVPRPDIFLYSSTYSPHRPCDMLYNAHFEPDRTLAACVDGDSRSHSRH